MGDQITSGALGACGRRGAGWRTTVLVVCCHLAWWPVAWPAWAAPDEDAVRWHEARESLEAQRAREARDRFQRLFDSPAFRFPALIGAAEASAMLDEPETALVYYQRALSLPDLTPGDERRALFGSARILVWLGRYPEAETRYRRLLTRPLDAQDERVARTGLIRSLALQDRPMAAYRFGRDIPESADAAERFELARAALWAGWPDKAQALLSAVAETDGRLADDVAGLRRDLADETGHPLTLRVDGSRDSDGFDADTTELTVGARIDGRRTVAGIVRWQSFRQRERRVYGRGLQARYEARVGDHLRLMLQGGLVRYGDRNTGVWSSRAVYRPADAVRVEAGATREVVESFPSFDRGVTADTLALSAEYRITHAVTSGAGVFGRRFSDGNERLGLSGNGRVVLSERVGLSAQLRARIFASSRNDVSGYFNPERFHETQIVMVVNRRLAPGWRLEVLAGPGLQRAAPGGGSRTSLMETQLAARLPGCLSSTLGVGYSDSALASASGYERYYGHVAISCPW
ncbi:MAG: hypothetical protein ABIO65_08435 [Nitrospiria bacterium]